MNKDAIEQLLNTENVKVLIESTSIAAVVLNLSDKDMKKVIGIDNSLNGVANLELAQSKRALYFLRTYMCLYSRFSGNFEHMRLWLNGFDRGTDGVPAEQIKDEDGLINVMEYLEAMRYGKY